MTSGILNIHKPSGVTSRRVVDQVQRLQRRLKAGHAGTLDPLASGVLVVCVGAATRLIEFVQQMPKQYEATFLLGRESPTEDIEGDVRLLDNPPVPTLAQIDAAASALTGRIMQRPPAYSALKLGGRRAYDLARRGEEVDLAPRPVDVYRIEVTAYDYPTLGLRIDCGSGTYVRSLGRDLAERLGSAAVMASLVRTAIGDFRLEDALLPEELTPDNWHDRLLPPLRAVAHLPHITVTADEATRLRNGQSIAQRSVGDPPSLAAIDANEQLIAIVEPRDGRIAPVRTFPMTEG